MTQAIAGIAPTEGVETTVITIWPSVSAMRLFGFPLGKLIGQFCSIQAGFYIFTVGNLCALLSVPFALLLYFKRIGPVVGMRYRLTNRRIIVERGLTFQEEKSVELDRFDDIQIVTSPGDEWYQSGDLVFRQGEIERFRLEGVSRPEAFRQICLKSHQAYVGVQQAIA